MSEESPVKEPIEAIKEILINASLAGHIALPFSFIQHDPVRSVQLVVDAMKAYQDGWRKCLENQPPAPVIIKLKGQHD